MTFRLVENNLIHCAYIWFKRRDGVVISSSVFDVSPESFHTISVLWSNVCLGRNNALNVLPVLLSCLCVSCFNVWYSLFLSYSQTFVGTISSINESFQVDLCLSTGSHLYSLLFCWDMLLFTLLSRLVWKYSHKSLTDVPRLSMFRISMWMEFISLITCSRFALPYRGISRGFCYCLVGTISVSV